jgi:hypothetical protein
MCMYVSCVCPLESAARGLSRYGYGNLALEQVAREAADPASKLMAMARGHAILCRRDIARVAMALRVEFSGQNHPVARKLQRVQDGLVKRVVRLIDAGRREGSIPAGPPSKALALALIGAMEGAVIGLSGQAPHDELLAQRVVAGVLGLAPMARRP